MIVTVVGIIEIVVWWVEHGMAFLVVIDTMMVQAKDTVKSTQIVLTVVNR
jgi:hypothetical protein